MSQQYYAFSLFQEECGEAMQSIGKAGRFGLDTPGVKDPYTGAVDMSITPRTSLQKELGDVSAAIDFIGLCGIVDKDAVNKRRFEKLSKLLDPSALDNLGNQLAPVPKYVAELESRIAALEAEKAEREAQEPAGQVIGINTVQWKGHGPILGAKLYYAPPVPHVDPDVRAAIGDDGKRMQPELIEYCKAMKRDAERYRVIRNAKEPIYGSRLDEIVDAAMGGGNG